MLCISANHYILCFVIPTMGLIAFPLRRRPGCGRLDTQYREKRGDLLCWIGQNWKLNASPASGARWPDARHHVVFGVGVRDAEVMLIGEGPGENEDLQGQPFVGRGGQLLDEMLELIDLSREKNVYIANIVKCRPPHNRDPLNTEQDACIDYLRNQVALIRPRIIVCLGRIAAMRLIKPDFKITREHGLWFEKSGVSMMAMFHPAAILRDPSRRPDTFMDLKSLQAKIREVCTHTYQ